MADINTKYTYVLEALRADGKKVMRFTNKPENRAYINPTTVTNQLMKLAK